MEKSQLLDIIAVDCVTNDPVDVRAGGPEILGFDFYTIPEETEELIKFIKVSLEKLEIPLQGIYISGKTNSNQVWNKERILASLLKNQEYLQNEAKRNYKPITKK